MSHRKSGRSAHLPSSKVDIKWFQEDDRVGNRIFDSWWEAEEWVDCILIDFSPFDNVGYMTPMKR